MHIEWHIEPSDLEQVRAVVASQWNRPFVLDRIRRNVDGALGAIGQDEIWQAQMMCLLTSQQRSGPNSPVSRFLRQSPFSLSLQQCRQAVNVSEFVGLALTKFGGIRFAPTIAERGAENLRTLEGGGWRDLLTYVDGLWIQRSQPPEPRHYELERKAAQYMDKAYKGFGPKQSRNFWQDLGLTRYEFVLDSRITAWLHETSFPVPLSAAALGDEGYYLFLSDILRRLCIEAGVLPCVFDAAVFASKDKQGWPFGVATEPAVLSDR